MLRWQRPSEWKHDVTQPPLPGKHRHPARLPGCRQTPYTSLDHVRVVYASTCVSRHMRVWQKRHWGKQISLGKGEVCDLIGDNQRKGRKRRGEQSLSEFSPCVISSPRVWSHRSPERTPALIITRPDTYRPCRRAEGAPTASPALPGVAEANCRGPEPRTLFLFPFSLVQLRWQRTALLCVLVNMIENDSINGGDKELLVTGNRQWGGREGEGSFGHKETSQ